ncbi:MAG TPA: ATP cone domain-containing protein, partial [Methylophilaceae bacterium]
MNDIVVAPQVATPEFKPPFPNSPSHQSLPTLQVIRRNGTVVGFDAEKISIALSKAFLAVESGDHTTLSGRMREQVASLTQMVVSALLRRLPTGGSVHIEDIQDQVELALMRTGSHDVARAYVLYREKRSAERAAQHAAQHIQAPELHANINGRLQPLDSALLLKMVSEACLNLGDAVEPKVVVEQALRDLYDGIPFNEVRKALILSARSLIEKEPAYNYVTARLQLDLIRAEVLDE